MKRRQFIPSVAATAMGSVISPSSFSIPNHISTFSADEQVNDEDFWKQIRSEFRTGKIINLNNGGVSPHPLVVEEAFFNYHRICNEVPSYSMWRVLEKQREKIRSKLSEIAGCFPEEIAINRNTTESLVTIIMGLPLKKGDEVVLSIFDYPRMMNAWKIREKEEGIKIRWVNPEKDNPDDSTIIERYTSQFNSKTRVVHITHMINWTGRIIPADKIIEEAKKYHITTIVDAAHTFAHIPFSIHDLGCDYLGASLHKWLSAPFGNGMLYIKKDKIAETKPFFPTEDELKNNIKKFEELGTRNNASEFAIFDAVDFYLSIGPERKYKRLVELRNYWVDQVKSHPKIKIHTPLEEGRSGAICLVEILDNKGMDIDKYLLKNYRIHCVEIEHEGIAGIRITPNIYTSKEELDILVAALLYFANA
jgi:selenocysteine lyase/cysteine desulfurase